MASWERNTPILFLLATTDGGIYNVDKMLARSFKTLKRCVKHSIADETIPIALDNRELSLLLNIYKTGESNCEILKEYDFDDFLFVLNAFALSMHFSHIQKKALHITNMSLLVLTLFHLAGERYNQSLSLAVIIAAINICVFYLAPTFTRYMDVSLEKKEIPAPGVFFGGPSI